MAKTTGKVTEKVTDEISNNTTNESQKELTPNEQKNLILTHLNSKIDGLWTPEAQIEKELGDKIHYYHIRQLLAFLKEEKHLDYSDMQISYKISYSGKQFILNGGYK